MESLRLWSNSISDISPLAGLTNLEYLYLSSNGISDISALSGLTHLEDLSLWKNSISDLSPLVANTGLGQGAEVEVGENPLSNVSLYTHIPALQSRGVKVRGVSLTTKVDIPDPNLRAAIENAIGIAPGSSITVRDMAGLTGLSAEGANISDLTGLETAFNLTFLNLIDNSISDLSALSGLTHLETLRLRNNAISDISVLGGLTNLTILNLSINPISDISVLSGLTNLEFLGFENNAISDISALSGLTNLRRLDLWNNSISDLSALSGLTNLTALNLWNNSVSDLSPLAGLTNLTWLGLRNNAISDISPLVANMGLGQGAEVNVGANPLSDASINTHIPALQSRGVEVRAEDLKPSLAKYLLSIPAGTSLIHVPLQVTAVDGVEQTLTSIVDLYDTLGGAGVVNFLITYDSRAQEWLSFFSLSDRGGSADIALADATGIVVGMLAPASVELSGNPLGVDGNSPITLTPGLNLVGLPLRDSRIARVSDLLNLDGIQGNVPVIILNDAGEFKAVGQAGDPGDVPITGGQGFILTAQREATVTLSGEAWTNTSAAAPASVAGRGIEVRDTMAVLGLKGSIVDEVTGMNQVGLRVTVKNLSTDRAVAGITAPDEAGYRLTWVDIETGRAARIGDTLEISAQSANPFIGVNPLRYTVTAGDVKRSLIRLPELVAYEIPAETELLNNYPNPFNPETWIPYRLAEDAFVTLTIYDQSGRVVHVLDVGHRIAAVYESRSKAIYWDGRNRFGEQVASGVYFYLLTGGDFSATRRMVMLK